MSSAPASSMASTCAPSSSSSSSTSTPGAAPLSSSTAPSKPAAVTKREDECHLYDPIAIVTDDGLKVRNRPSSPIQLAPNPFSVLEELGSSSNGEEEKQKKKKKKKRNRSKKQ